MLRRRPSGPKRMLILMALAARNDPCPCGSGRKYKKCCGFDLASQRALEDQLVAVKEIARLAFRSPQLVPLSDGYEAWLHAVLADEKTARPEDAITTLGAAECRRIVEVCLALYPVEWAMLAGRCHDEHEALTALVGGAVVAGIRDYQPLARRALETVEQSDDLCRDPAEALAMCLHGDQLWDIEEGRVADSMIGEIPDGVSDDVYERRFEAAVDDVAARWATDWHHRRLANLVARIGDQLPREGYPQASVAILAGCEQFASDERVRLRLAATLLGDLIGRDDVERIRALFAA